MEVRKPRANQKSFVLTEPLCSYGGGEGGKIDEGDGPRLRKASIVRMEVGWALQWGDMEGFAQGMRRSEP